MKQLLIFVVIVMVLGGLAFLFLWSGFDLGLRDNPGDGAKPTPTGEALPEFSFKNYDGISVRSFEFRGKPTVINSWASWCPFCLKELKDFADAQKEFAGRAAIVAINRAESRETAKKFTDDLGVSNDLVFLLDPSDSFYAAIRALAMPETIFVSPTGVIVDRFRGQIMPDVLREKINTLLQ